MLNVATQSRRSRAVGLVLTAIMLFMVAALPASASVNALRNAFNPRGFFLTVKSTGEAQWLRSSFTTGYYGSGGGQGGGSGGGGGGGQGANEEKDDLGHSNVQYVDGEVGLDYIDAAEVDTIYSVYDHNPTPGKDFMVGYFKEAQADSPQEIPDLVSHIGSPSSGASVATDPSGGQGWKVPIRLDLGEEQPDGSRNALAPGTLYEFAFLRGNRANNGTSCVLMPGEEEGTYKGYISFKGTVTEEEQAEYDAHKYDEYEFITNILPAGSSSDITVDHTVESVPMRYRIQTFAKLTSWTGSAEYQEAESLLASVTEADYNSGKYVHENIAALRATFDQLKEEADTSVKYQLQKDAEWTIQQMIEDLKRALEIAKSPQETVNFDDYNTALSNAESTYESIKDRKGTAIDQYRPEPVDALKAAIDHAKNTISGTSSQSDVDAETTALNQARMDALNALVRPDETIFQDSSTGIIVTAPASALPSTAQLAVREVINTSGEYNSYVSRISPKPDAAVIYRIVFFDGTEVVAPTQPVKVQIPLQNTLEQTAPAVYYLDDTSAPGQNMNATVVSGYRIFTTSRMGTFAVAGQKQSTPQELTPQVIPPQDQPQQQNQTPQQNQNNGVHTTTRTTTRRVTQRTTRIIRTTRDPNNDQNKKNEVSSTSVLQTQAVQPTTMTTTAPAPTTANDTSDLEQDANPNTMLYIALGIAAAGLGTLGYQLVRDGKLKGKDDDDAQL